MAKITKGVLVKVGAGKDEPITSKNWHPVPIITENWSGRSFHREKVLRPGQFLFGTVQSVMTLEREEVDPKTKMVTKPAKGIALIRWLGPKYRVSTLPLERLIVAKKPKPETAETPTEEKTE